MFIQAQKGAIGYATHGQITGSKPSMQKPKPRLREPGSPCEPVRLPSHDQGQGLGNGVHHDTGRQQGLALAEAGAKLEHHVEGLHDPGL